MSVKKEPSDEGTTAAGVDGEMCLFSPPASLQSTAASIVSTTSSGGSGSFSQQSLSSIILSQNSDGAPHFNLSQNTLTMLMETLNESAITGSQHHIAASQAPPIDASNVSRNNVSAMAAANILSTQGSAATSISCDANFPTSATSLPQQHQYFPYFPTTLPFAFAIPNLPAAASSPLVQQHQMTQQIVREAMNVYTPPAFSPAAIPAVSPSLNVAAAGHHVALVARPESPFTPTPSSGNVNIPQSAPFSGRFGFEISFPAQKETDMTKRSTAYVYSEALKKLYAKPGTLCPINFKCTSGNPPPAGSIIRATVVFSKLNDAGEIVRRCNNHVAEDDNNPIRDHFLRIQHDHCQYYQDASEGGRQCVIVPWDTSPSTQETGFITYLFQFMCYTSCSGKFGINRRPIHLIVTLEFGNQLLGRQGVDLRTCACPTRDKSYDENPQSSSSPGDKKRKRHLQISTSDSADSTTITAADQQQPMDSGDDDNTGDGGDEDGDQELYLLQIRGRKIYRMLRKIYDDHLIAELYRRKEGDAGRGETDGGGGGGQC